MDNLISSKYFIWVVLIFLAIIILCCMNYNNSKTLNNLNQILLLTMFTNKENKPVMLDEEKFKHMVSLQYRDPKWLTSSMVAPIGSENTKEEKNKISKMEIFNLMYNNGIDDETTINSRPKGLYVVP